jgi:hypothetical protein
VKNPQSELEENVALTLVAALGKFLGLSIEGLSRVILLSCAAWGLRWAAC